MDGDMDITAKTRSCLKNMSRKFGDFCMETIESLDSQYQTAQATLENLYSEFVEEFIPMVLSLPNNDSVTLDDSSDQHTSQTESREYFPSEEVLTNDESLVDTPLLQSDDTNLVPHSTTCELLVNKPLDQSNDLNVEEINLSPETPKSVPPAPSDSTDDIYSIIRPKEEVDYALELEALLREQEEWRHLGGVGEFSRSFCSSDSMSEVSTNDDVFGVKHPNEEKDYDLELQALLREQKEWEALGGVGMFSRSFCSSESLSEVSIDYTDDIIGVKHPNEEKDYDLEAMVGEQEEWRALGGVGVFSRSFLSEIANDLSVDSCSDGKSDDFYSVASANSEPESPNSEPPAPEEENYDLVPLTLTSSVEGVASRKSLLSYREFYSNESSSEASNGRSDDSSEGELENDCATELFKEVTRPFVKDLMDGCCFARDDNACASYVSSEAQIAHYKTTLYELYSGFVEQDTPSVSSNPNNDVTLDSSSIQQTSNSAHLASRDSLPSEAPTNEELLVYTPLQQSDDTNLVPEAIADELLDKPMDQSNDLVEEKNLSPETPKSNKEEEEEDGQFPLQTSMTKNLEDLSTSAGVSSGISLFSLACSSCSSESLSGVSNDAAHCDGESVKSDDCSSDAEYGITGRSDDGNEGEPEDDCVTEPDIDDLMQPFEKEVDEIHSVMDDDKQHVSISLSGVKMAPYFQVYEPESFEFVDAYEADYTLADPGVTPLDDHDASDADWEII